MIILKASRLTLLHNELNKLISKNPFMRTFLITLIAFNCSFSYSQMEIIDSTSILSNLDSLKTKFLNHKTIIREYELAILHSLSYYPELIDTKISFKKAKIKTTLNARPSVGSLLFCSKKDRNYVIRINQQLKDSVINFSTIPFNAKVGLLGHELGHILDYKDKTIFQVTKRLLAYSSKKTKAKFEKEIDYLTIKKKLGWQLYAWANFVLNESNAAKKYKEFKKEIYLTPSQISDIIKNGEKE